MQALKARLIDRYTQASIPQRFYAAAIATYLIGCLVFWNQGFAALEGVSMITCGLIISGFIAWCYPLLRWLHSSWERPLAKIPLVILHLLVLLIATACARHAVSESLGLPPQSFDLTVGLLALLFYIPAWLGVLATLITPFALLGWLLTGLGLGLDHIWHLLTRLTGGIGYRPVLKRYLGPLLFHCTGALMGSLLLASSFGYLTANFGPAFQTATRLTVLYSDFHDAPNYPGVQSGERVHPLENGYVAYARQREDKGLEFGVRLQASDAPEKEILTIASPKPAIAAFFANFYDTLQSWTQATSPAD